MDPFQQAQSPHHKHPLSPQPPPNGTKRKKNDRGQSIHLSHPSQTFLTPHPGPSTRPPPRPSTTYVDPHGLEYDNNPPIEPYSNPQDGLGPPPRQFNRHNAEEIYTPTQAKQDAQLQSQTSLSQLSSLRSSQYVAYNPHFFAPLGSHKFPAHFGKPRSPPERTPAASIPVVRSSNVLSQREIEVPLDAEQEQICSQLVNPTKLDLPPSPRHHDIPASQKAPYTLDNEIPKSAPHPPTASLGPPHRLELKAPADSPSALRAFGRSISPPFIPSDDEDGRVPAPNPAASPDPLPAPDPYFQSTVSLPVLRTFPRQLHDHETLRPLNLRFNDLYKVPYCITCARCFWSTSLQGHVKDCWARSVEQPREMARLIAAAIETVTNLGGKKKSDELQLQVPDPAFRLLITPFEGVRTEELFPCSHCYRGARSEKALREHYRKHHPTVTYTPSRGKQPCQTPFPGQASPIFQVHRIFLPNEDGPSDHDIAMYGYEESKASFDPVVVTHDGLRHNNHFLEFSNLADWAAGHALTVNELLEFRSMTTIPQSHSDPWYQLAHHISSYFQDIVSQWSTENSYIRKHLRSDQPYHISTYPLDDFEETDTFRKYVNKWVKLFVFLRNQRKAPQGHRLKFAVLTDAQTRALDTLIRLFTPGATFQLPHGTPVRSMGIVPTPIPAPTPAPQGTTSKRQPRPRMTEWETAVAQAIHNLSIQIIQHSYSGRSVSDGAVVMFVAALALEASGTWDNGRNVSPKLSGLVWCFRTVSFKLIVEEIEAEPGDDPEDVIIKKHMKFLSMTTATPFEWTRGLAKRITNAIGYLPKVPKIYVDEKGSLLIDKHRISFDQLCQFAHDTRTKFKQSLQEVFRFIGGGASQVMDWDWKGDEIVDSWACPEHGYSFLYDPKNDSLGWPKADHLVHCLIESKQFHTRSDNTITWNLKMIHELNHLLRTAMVWSIVAIHTTSGGTSRGTEITSHRRRNGTRQRNFFWYHSRFLVLGLYHKGSHSGRDKFLPRTVDPELSIWLVILHRLFPELQHYIHVQILKTDPQVAHRFYEEAYFDGYRQLDRTDVNWGLGEASEPIIGSRMPISVFRHAIVELHKETLLTLEDSKLLQAVIDAHSAHSSATAEANYAITPEDQVASRQLIRKFVLISIAHQKLLGLPTDGEASIIYEMKMVPDGHVARARMADPAPPRHDTDGRLQRSCSGAATGLTFHDLKHAVQLPMEVFRSQIHGWMETLQQVVNRTSKELEAARLGREVRVHIPQDLLQALLTTKQLTRFKSTNQARLAQLSRDRQTNIGGFISTNAGKTLAVTLPSHPLLNPRHRTTVIAVPYTALQLDIWRRRTLFKDIIDIVMWDPHNQPDTVHPPEIIVATFDALLNPQLQRFCQALGSQLARLVIDEAHIVILDRTWRQSLSQASEWRQLDCPVTLLAGIMTRPLLDELKLVFALHTPLAIIEEPPHRPEIRYSSMELPDKSFRQQTWDLKHFAQIVQTQVDGLKGPDDRVLTYVTSRKLAEELAKELGCDYYHAGLSTERQIQVSENWRKGVSRVLICTKAYGTGIDFPCVRVVIHLDLPDTMFDWLQETGRAGRDGLPATALTVYPTGAADRLPQEIQYELVLGGKRELVYGILSGSRCYREFAFEFLGYDAYSCAFYGRPTRLCDRCEQRQGTAFPPNSALVSTPSAPTFPQDNDWEPRAQADVAMQPPRFRTTSAPSRASPLPKKPPAWARPINPSGPFGTASGTLVSAPSPHTPGQSLGAATASIPLLNYTPSSTYHQPQVVHNHFYAYPPPAGSHTLGLSGSPTTVVPPFSDPTIRAPHQLDGGRPIRRDNDPSFPSQRANESRAVLPKRKPAPTAAPAITPTTTPTAARKYTGTPPVLKDLVDGPVYSAAQKAQADQQNWVVLRTSNPRPIPVSQPLDNASTPTAPKAQGNRVQPASGNRPIPKPVSNRARPEHFRESVFFKQDLGEHTGGVAPANSESATIQQTLTARDRKIEKVRQYVRVGSETCMYCWIAHGSRARSHTAYGPNKCRYAPSDAQVTDAVPTPEFFGQGGGKHPYPAIKLTGCCTICRTPWLCTKPDGGIQHEDKDIILPVVGLGHIFLQEKLLRRLHLSPTLSYQDFREWCTKQSAANAKTLIHNLHEAFIAVFQILEEDR